MQQKFNNVPFVRLRKPCVSLFVRGVCVSQWPCTHNKDLHQCAVSPIPSSISLSVCVCVCLPGVRPYLQGGGAQARQAEWSHVSAGREAGVAGRGPGQAERGAGPGNTLTRLTPCSISIEKLGAWDTLCVCVCVSCERERVSERDVCIYEYLASSVFC